MFIDSCHVPERLSKEEELEHIKRAQAGDVEAMNTLLLSNFSAIVSSAKRLKYSCTTLEDAIQESVLAFYDAVFRYEDRGNSLYTYAKYLLLGRLHVVGKRDVASLLMLTRSGVPDANVPSVTEEIINMENHVEAVSILESLDDDYVNALVSRVYKENLDSNAAMSLHEFRRRSKQVRSDIEERRSHIPLLTCRNAAGDLIAILCTGHKDWADFVGQVHKQRHNISGYPESGVYLDDVNHGYFFKIGEESYRDALEKETGAFAGTIVDIRRN